MSEKDNPFEKALEMCRADPNLRLFAVKYALQDSYRQAATLLDEWAPDEAEYESTLMGEWPGKYKGTAAYYDNPEIKREADELKWWSREEAELLPPYDWGDVDPETLGEPIDWHGEDAQPTEAEPKD